MMKNQQPRLGSVREQEQRRGLGAEARYADSLRAADRERVLNMVERVHQRGTAGMIQEHQREIVIALGGAALLYFAIKLFGVGTHAAPEEPEVPR